MLKAELKLSTFERLATQGPGERDGAVRSRVSGISLRLTLSKAKRLEPPQDPEAAAEG